MTINFSVFLTWSTLLVLTAAMLDIFANLLLAASNGFKKLAYGFGALLMVGGAFYCLSLAVREMDLAVAYALWGSFGILGTSIGGWIFFGQKLKPAAFAGILILVTGMILLRTE